MKRQNRTGGVSDCVEPEVLAAYVDGTLDATGHGDVEAHLADCDVCREIVAEAALAREGLGAVAAGRPTSGRFLNLASRGRRIWPTIGVLAAAAAVTLALVIPRLMRPGDPSARPELAELVAAVGEHRPFEPRLTGGFRYGPLAPVYRSGGGSDPALQPAVAAAVAKLELRLMEQETAPNLAASAAGELVCGRPDAAVRMLERAVRLDPGRAVVWNDLAAAYLVRARHLASAGDAERSFDAANRALALEPALEEALYNRALALEALGKPADLAWKEVTEQTPPSAWKAEARRRIRQ